MSYNVFKSRADDFNSWNVTFEEFINRFDEQREYNVCLCLSLVVEDGKIGYGVCA